MTLDAPTVGGGAVIASDDIAGVQHQRIKVGFGADGFYSDVASGNPLPVTAANAALAVVGAGTEATALRVTIANDSTGLVSIDDGGGSLTVDGTVTANLSATDNAVLDSIDTSTAAAAASLALLDNAIAGTELQVDIVSAPTLVVDSELTTADLDTGVGTDTRAVVGIVGSASGGGVLIPGSAAGLKVDLGADNDVTVTGTVTANLSATDNAVLDSIDASTAAAAASLTLLDNAVAGSELQVDVVAALPAGANAIGKLAANSGVDIGDVDVTSVTPGTTATALGKAEDAGHTTGDVGVMALAVRNDAGGTLAGLDLDYAPLQLDAAGNVRVNIAAGSSSGVQYNRDTVAGAADTGTVALVVRKDVGGTLVDLDGDRSLLQVDANGALRVAGGGGGTEYTVNAAAPADPIGATFVMERDDALSALTEVEGDWTNPRSNANGALWTAVNGTVTVDGSGVTQPVSNAGLTALAGAIAGSEVQVDIVAAPTLTVDLGVNNDVTVTSGNITADTELTTADLDLGVGTDTRAVIGIVGSKSGGAQRIPGDETAGLKVDLGADNDVTVAGVATAANQSTIIGHVDGIEALLTTIDADTSNLSVVGGGTEAAAIRVTIANDSTGLVSVDDGGGLISVDDGAGSLTVDGTVTVNVVPVASGGLSISRTISAASTNATSAKASAGQVYGWFVSNVNAAARYLKLYNKASAPTVGSDTPVFTILIPGNTAGAGATVEFANGIAFGTGIAYAITTGATDADTGAVAANEIIVNLLYK